MRFLRSLAWIGGLLLAAVLTLTLWLCWPLPQSRADWQAVGYELAGDAACSDLEVLIYTVASVDPDGVEVYLSEAPLYERCPVFDETYGPDARTYVGGREMEIRVRIGEIRVARAEDEARAAGYSLFVRMAGVNRVAALANWIHYRSYRRAAGAGWLGWPELVFSFRCELAVDYGARAHDENIFATLPPRIADRLASPAWRDRRARCADFAARTGQALVPASKASDAHGGNGNAQARMELSQYYLSAAGQWGWEG